MYQHENYTIYLSEQRNVEIEAFYYLSIDIYSIEFIIGK